MLQEFSQEVENTARSVVDEIHTALPATIVAFDAAKGLANVQPIGKYVTADGSLINYPTITEAPIVFPYSQQSNVGIGFPIKVGDSCMVIISEVELDEWRSGADSEGSLRFDLTSAMVIPGLIKGNVKLTSKATNSNAVVISSGSSEITVSKGGIAISGSLTVSGNITCTGDIKSGAISLQNHTHTSSEPGSSTGKAE